ncbi:unnamed protein product [Arctogadus glacialis]
MNVKKFIQHKWKEIQEKVEEKDNGPQHVSSASSYHTTFHPPTPYLPGINYNLSHPLRKTSTTAPAKHCFVK